MIKTFFDIIKEQLVGRKILLSPNTGVEYTPKGETGLKYKKLDNSTLITVNGLHHSEDDSTYLLEFILNGERHIMYVGTDFEFNFI